MELIVQFCKMYFFHLLKYIFPFYEIRFCFNKLLFYETRPFVLINTLLRFMHADADISPLLQVHHGYGARIY